MHPINKKNVQVIQITKPMMAVIIEVQKSHLVVLKTTPKICEEGTAFAKVPDYLSVVDENGDTLSPLSGFWISTTTVNPFHLLIDYEPYESF